MYGPIVPFNLAAPVNQQQALDERCKRLASLWINQLARQVITRAKVDRLLAKMPSDEQALMRQWLNHYRQLKPQTVTVKQEKGQRALPDNWIKQRKKMKRLA